MKIGFACIYNLPPELESTASSKAEAERWAKYYRLRDTTMKWLTNNSSVAEDRLWEILEHNCMSLLNLVEKVSSYPKEMRMVRFGSGICPGYTHKDWSWFYLQDDVQKYLDKHLSKVGKLARKKGVKLSFHPGQFTVLASDKPDVVNASISEFEYHVDICKYLGFGKRKLDMKVNVHLSGKGGIPEFKRTYNRLSVEARRLITLENDEFGAGIDDILPLYKKIGIVLDIHHHWIHSEGEYIKPNDSRMEYVLESWKGKRPTIHYSNSKELYTVNESQRKLYSYSDLVAQEFARTKLRAHSMMFGNSKMNQWALGFLPECDIMCEAKAKNLASTQLYLDAKKLGIL